MRWITSTHLEQWADKKEFEGLLPELLRRLIIASCNTFPQITIPVGDSIYKAGWDGQCFAENPLYYVPQGQSYWEWGRDDNFRAKANGDFNKRASNTEEDLQRNSTYVFVTPRRWDTPTNSKEDWALEKLALSNWSNIKVYDADDLECWLEQFPGVSLWLARQLNLASNIYLRSAEDFWQDFTSTKAVTLSADLIIAGRDKEKEAVLKFLSNKHGVKEVQASSEAEAINFIISSAINNDDSAEQTFFNRAIIVTNKDTLREMVSMHKDLVIIYSAGKDELLSNFDAGANHVFNTVSYQVNVTKEDIVVPIPNGELFTNALNSLGLEYSAAYDLTGKCGRSFSVLKRMLSEVPGRVSWREGHDIRELIPMFLIHHFDDQVEGDREVIELLSGQKYEYYKEKLKKWALIFDNPVYQRSNHWRVVSGFDLLFVIAKNITEEHLKNFEQIVYKVLGEVDPALELEPQHRFAAALFKKKSQYSPKAKSGLAQALLLLSVHGKGAGINIGFDILNWVDTIVSTLLGNFEINRWQSIAGKLDVFAEVAPEAFLQAIETVIKKNPETIANLLDDNHFNFFSPVYHTQLLRGLELIAWTPSYLSRVSLILCDLVTLDKGSKLANRPIKSLRHIFFLLLPQTLASQQVRNDVLKLIIRKKPEVAFKLLMEISPRHHEIGHYNHKPTWRLRDISAPAITTNEWTQGISVVCDLLIEVSGNDPEKWVKLIELIDDFYGKNITKLINALVNSTAFEGGSIGLREVLRKFIYRQENFRDKEIALSTTDIAKLKSFYEQYLVDDIERYYWYFDEFGIESKKYIKLGFEELGKISNAKRVKAIGSIYASLGFDGVLKLCNRAQKPFLIGRALAEIALETEDQIIDLIADTNPSYSLMSQGYIEVKASLLNTEWIKQQADRLNNNASPVALVTFFLSIAPSVFVWDLLAEKYPEADKLYWEQAFKNSYFRGNNFNELFRCIKKLNSLGRYTSSLNIIRYERKETPPELIIEVLKGLVTHPAEDGVELDDASWIIPELFKRLDQEEVDVDTMAILELYYASLLNDPHSGRPIIHLFDAIAKDPALFVELLTWSYIPETRDPAEVIAKLGESVIKSRAMMAHELLESWVCLPGQSESGEIDFSILKTWVDQALILSQERDRKSRGYREIGKMFGRLRETTTNWPQPEICEIIEDLDEVKLNNGFVDGAFNGGGVKVTINAPSDGSLSREKAEKYRALSLQVGNQYPLIASLLVEVAKMHESWASFKDRNHAQDDINY
jgi:hypothetical protein